MAKELHGLRRTRFKGRWKVQIQFWLTAAAINIKRAIRKLRKMGFMAKGAGATALSSLADAAKKIAAGIHRVLFRLHNHFGNSPCRRRTVEEALLSSPQIGY